MSEDEVARSCDRARTLLAEYAGMTGVTVDVEGPEVLITDIITDMFILATKLNINAAILKTRIEGHVAAAFRHD